VKCTRWGTSKEGVFDDSAALEAKLKNASYNVTSLTLPSGAYQSDHSHPEPRAEAVISGRLRIKAGDTECELGPGDFVELARGEVHNAQVLGTNTTRILEGRLISETSEPFLVPRLVALAVLLLVLNFWLTRHLGFGLRDILLVNAIIIFLPQVLRWLDPREQLTVERFFRRGLWYLARPLSLPVLLLALIVALLAWSSVEVRPGLGFAPTEVSIASDPKTAPPFPPSQLRRTVTDRQEVFVLGISPRGSRYHLRAEGYFRETLVLYPWTQRAISLDTLDALPSILLRLPRTRLGEGGSLEIYTSAEQTSKAIEIAPWQGSITLGAPVQPALLDAWATRWLDDLSDMDSNYTLQQRHVEMWTRTVTLDRRTLLARGDQDLWDELLQPGSIFQVAFRSSRTPEVLSTRLQDIVSPTPGERQQLLLEADD